MHARTTWGGGFSLGVYYEADNWSYGASFKSPQWFQSFRFNTSDELGMPRTAELDLDTPTPSASRYTTIRQRLEPLLKSDDTRTVNEPTQDALVSVTNHTTATLTQLIGGSESNRQLHSSPLSRPSHS